MGNAKIEEILEGFLWRYVDAETPLEAENVLNTAKHTLKELILKEVIGEDDNSDDYGNGAHRDELRAEQRTALDKLFGE